VTFVGRKMNTIDVAQKSKVDEFSRGSWNG
jgi:hypothetical protein